MISLHVHWPRAGSQRSFSLHGRAVIALGGLVVGALLGSFALGASLPLSEALRERRAVRQALNDQRAQLDESLLTARARAQALAGRLGELQGRLTQLEAVGQRVSEAARLAPDAFDFDTPLDTGLDTSGADEQPFAVVDFVAALDGLSRQIDRRAAQFAVLDRVIGADLLEHDEALPSPVPGGRLSSAFGSRRDPFSGRREFHGGVDFRAPSGTPIHAIAGGRVVVSGWESGYGRVIEIDHGNGFRTRYAHNQANLVKAGQTVKRRQVIAHVGSTGHTTGPHVHLEVLRAGRRMDPADYLRALAAQELPLRTAAR